jgi:hypothetical protein
MKFMKWMSVLFICVFVFSAQEAFAGSCSSNGAGVNWSEAANWTGSCVGAGGGIPGAGDDVTIAAGFPITLDINTPALKTLTIDSTLDTGADRTVNITGGPGSSGTLAINGTMNANGSVINLGGQFQQFAGTFNAETSTVNINMNGYTTFIYGNVTFYNLVFNPTMTGNLPWSIGNSPIVINNNFTISPSAASALTLTATMGNSISVGGTLTISPSGSALANLNTGGETLSASLVVIGVGGTLTANDSTINLTGTSGTLLSGGGTFTAGTSTVDLTGDGSPTINTGTLAFYNLTSSGTGTKTLGANISLAAGGTLSVTDGAFSPSSYTVSNGAGNTLSVGSGASIYVDGATFSGNYDGFDTVALGTGSTVMYTMGGDQTIDSTLSYYNLATDVSGTKSLDGETTITNALATYGGTFSTASHTVNVGHVLINGGAFSAGTSIVNLTGTSVVLFAYTSGSSQATSATVNITGNGSATVSSGGTPGFSSLTLSGTGTKTLGGDVAVSSSFVVSNGTLNPSTYTVNGSGTATLSVTGGTLIVAAATFAGNYPNFTAGTFSTGSTASYNRAGGQTIDSTKTYADLSLSGSGNKSPDGTLTATGTVTVGGIAALDTGSGTNFTLNMGSLVIDGGTMVPNASTVNLTGTSGTLITLTTGGASVGTGTFNLTGNGDATLLSSGSWTFYNLTSSGTGTKSLTGGARFGINAPGVFSVTNGTFDMGTGTSTSSGGAATISISNATINIGAATFDGNFSGFAAPTLGTGSTVNYNGSVTQTILNSVPYYNLTISGSAREVDFPTTGTTTITNAFTVSGTAGNVISLFSPTPGAAWTFVPSGSASVSYVNVRDSVCGPGAISFITQTEFTNSGNNGSCWFATVTTTPAGVTPVIIVPVRALGSDPLGFTLGKITEGVIELSFNADPASVTGYAASFDPAFTNEGIHRYTAGTIARLTLPDASGTQTVYVQFFSSTGARSVVFSQPVSHQSKSTAVVSPKNTFSRTLSLGKQGPDVTALQKILVADGALVMPVGASYGYFGGLTKKAVQTFQEKYAISSSGTPGYGTFGPKTRARAELVSML